MQIAAKRDRKSSNFILSPLQYDENSQELKLVRKHTNHRKSLKFKIKLINNERCIISKINLGHKDTTIKNDINKVRISELFRVDYALPHIHVRA